MGLNLRAVGAIMKKEFMDNIRNRWILLVTIIFLILTIVTPLAVGFGDWGGFALTVAFMMAITSILIPLLAIILGHGTIAGEAEDGSLNVVMAYPIKRVEVLVGKVLGLTMVIATPVVIGYGIGGIIIATNAGSKAWGGYLAFLALSILLGVIYLSITISISAVSARRSTAIGGSILVFFWGWIAGTLFLAIYMATGGSIESLAAGELPGWFFSSNFISPSDLSQTTVMLAFESDPAFGLGIDLPGYINLGTTLVAHLWWILLPLLIAYLAFQKRDI